MAISITYCGSMNLRGLVDITDPCYDTGEGWRMVKEVKSGKYNCYIWRGLVENEPYLICGIGIYHKGSFTSEGHLEMPDAKEVGTISVDAGLAGFFNNKPNYSDSEWDKLCEELGDNDMFISCKSFFARPAFGDSSYPVYAYKQNSEVVGLEIRFVEGGRSTTPTREGSRLVTAQPY